jgi:hypothetical protein
MIVPLSGKLLGVRIIPECWHRWVGNHDGF